MLKASKNGDRNIKHKMVLPIATPYYMGAAVYPSHYETTVTYH